MHPENKYVYEVETEAADLNESGILKPYAYQKLFARVVEQHLNKININVDTTMKYGLAWALISMTLEIEKPVSGCIRLFAKTWHSERHGPFFRREMLAMDANGETVFRGASFSVLLDINKRSFYRKRDLPFSIMEPIEEYAVTAKPTKKLKPDYFKVDERAVRNSYIDRLGHTNNCRYGEFAYDVFSEEERLNLMALRRLEFYFSSELRLDDQFSILKAYEENAIFVKGMNDTKSDVSFDVVFEFQ